jgi:hypothetical protein
MLPLSEDGLSTTASLETPEMTSTSTKVGVSAEDRSPSPEPPGPRVFSKTIRNTQLSVWFCPPSTLTKYNGETKPELWLADFRLAC